MKQTAVEWLVQQLEQHYVNIDIKNTVVFNQAKEMEKEQIMSTFEDRHTAVINSEEYYIKKFK